MKYGLSAAIVDSFDTELLKIARGERPKITAVIYRTMDGEKIDLTTLDEETRKYAKTVRVLNGESLYSHSWLEI
jgi:5-methyltetrahydrofolate corrinoid/iron sulfur protein methyltransferase